MKKWHLNQKNKLKRHLFKSQKAFTLIEILVVIAIIAILIMGTNLLNYKNISSKQELDTKAIQVASHIENIRNNALLGRGIGTNLMVAKKYKINFSTNGSGSIDSYYFDGTNYKNYIFDGKTIIFNNGFKLTKINCLKIDNTLNNTLNNTEIGTLIIEGSNLEITGDCNANTKILELEIEKRLNKKIIQINTINGLIKIKD